MTRSPVGSDENIDKFPGPFYRVEVKALYNWATVTHFMQGNIRFVVQEAEVTNDFRQFLKIMYGSYWEKSVLGYQTMILKHLYALITVYGKLTPRTKWARLNH